MHFGVIYIPTMFQNFINDVLSSFLDWFVTAYLNHILIYSDNLNQHRWHVRSIVNELGKTWMHLNGEKCEFYQTQVIYLSPIFGNGRVGMGPARTTAVKDFPVFKSVVDVRSFVKFAKFYLHFILNFLNIVRPQIALTSKVVIFQWKENEQKAFEILK